MSCKDLTWTQDKRETKVLYPLLKLHKENITRFQRLISKTFLNLTRKTSPQKRLIEVAEEEIYHPCPKLYTSFILYIYFGSGFNVDFIKYIIINGRWQLKENWLLFTRQNDRLRNLRKSETSNTHSNRVESGHKNPSKRKDNRRSRRWESIAINPHFKTNPASQYNPALWGKQSNK